MLAIYGIFNFDSLPINPEMLIRMRDNLAHRDQDDYGDMLLSSGVEAQDTKQADFKLHLNLV